MSRKQLESKTMAAAKEICLDAAAAAVLLEPDGVYT